MQQRIALVALRMHTAKSKKKNYKKEEKSRYSDLFSWNNSTNTTKTPPEVQLLQKRRLQEGNGAQAPSSPVHRS
jgi:hypothetical protein